MSAEAAEQIILEGRGAHFDPVLVDIFKALAPKFAIIAENCNKAMEKAAIS
jgi:response regulator RpfG family c-di-GMP phosphodiesterase